MKLTHSLFVRKLLLISFVGAIAITLFAGFFNRYLYKSRADQDAVTVAFNPSTLTLVSGSSSVMNVTLSSANESNSIDYAKLVFTTDGNIQITKADILSSIDSASFNFVPAYDSVITPDGKKLSVFFINQLAEKTTSKVQLPITVKAVSGTSGTLQFVASESEAKGFDQNLTQKQYAFTGSTQSNITINGNTPSTGGQTTTEENSVSVGFDPSSIAKTTAEVWTTNLIIKDPPTGKKISGFKVDIQYNQNIIDITGFGVPIDTDTQETNKFTQLQGNYSNGVINLNYIINTSLNESQWPKGIKLPINVRSKNPGVDRFTITSAVVIGNVVGGNYSIKNLNNPDAIYNITQAQVANVPPPAQGTCSAVPYPNIPAQLGYTYQFQGYPSCNYTQVPNQQTAPNTCPAVNVPGAAPVNTQWKLSAFPNCQYYLGYQNSSCALTNPPGIAPAGQAYLEWTCGQFILTPLQVGVGTCPAANPPGVAPAGQMWRVAQSPNCQYYLAPSNTTCPTLIGVGQAPQGQIYLQSPSPNCNVITPVQLSQVPIGQSVPVTLNIKLKFQGITMGGRSPIQVKVNMVGVGYTAPIANPVTFTQDSQQPLFWNGTVTTNAPVGENVPYKIYTKGPKHTQKKICENQPPVENPGAEGTYTCGEGKITLAQGVNNLDLSGVYQMGGDLPDQDSVVNSRDLVVIRRSLNTTEASCDINLDGQCNIQDYSLTIFNLSTKPDERL